MKRIKIFAAIVVTFLTINAAKAQVGVHVGLNFGAPYHRVYAPAYGYYGPRYYAPAPVYYGPRYYGYRGPAYYPVHAYYGRPWHRGGYYRPYRRW